MTFPRFNSIDLLTWAQIQGASLGLKLSIYSEFSAIWPSAVAVHASLPFRGMTATAHGYGETIEQATIVATAEVIERCTLFSYPRSAGSSNGFAVHTDPLKAQRSAIFELLERDAYLCHHLTRTPFSKISIFGKESLSGTCQDLSDICQRMGWNLIFARMRSLGAGHGIAIFVDGSESEHQFGIICSFSYDKDYNRAMEKAARETMSMLACHTIIKSWPGMSLDAFKMIENPRPSDHGTFARHNDKHDWMRTMFTDHSTDEPKKMPDPTIKVEKLKIPDELLNPPLFAYRASSTDVQNLFFGLPTPNVLNFARLQSFASRKLTFEDLETETPHFLD